MLDGVRFYGCRFENVRFDGAHFRELRMWKSSFADCSFESANLGGWAIGGVEDRVRNRLERCSFVRADLRGAAGGAPHFEHCVFDHARLDRVDFDGGLFRRCVFRGPLVEVGFSRRAWAQKVNEDNDMLEVDFSDAELIYTMFHDLPLATVTWPTSESHLLFAQPSCVMKHLRTEMLAIGTPDARGIAGLIEATLRNSHPKREIGIFHVEELGSMSTHIRKRCGRLSSACSTRGMHWWRCWPAQEQCRQPLPLLAHCDSPVRVAEIAPNRRRRQSRRIVTSRSRSTVVCTTTAQDDLGSGTMARR